MQEDSASLTVIGRPARLATAGREAVLLWIGSLEHHLTYVEVYLDNRGIPMDALTRAGNRMAVSGFAVTISTWRDGLLAGTAAPRDAAFHLAEIEPRIVDFYDMALRGLVSCRLVLAGLGRERRR